MPLSYKVMKKVVFRFDIDTHKCIRDGVPNLIKISEKYDIGFTFFLNTGRAIDLKQSFFELFRTNENVFAAHLGAFKKLGLIDFLEVIFLNPLISDYKHNIQLIINSKNELGLHGGRNHAKWHRGASSWTPLKILSELIYGLNCIYAIDPVYKIHSFASPGWTTGANVEAAVRELGFKYFCDIHSDLPLQKLEYIDGLVFVPTNILAEPGGVAFFEHCAALGKNDDEIIELFFDNIYLRDELAIVYDHPYWVGIHSCNILDKIVFRLLSEGYEICTIKELAS